jgi:uncharacterized protein YndB with AHSA1/START domain
MKQKNVTQIVVEPGRQDFTISREFDAPREKLFRAFVEPDLLVQWLGPRRLSMEIDHMTPVTGGAYRFVHHDDNGNSYGFNGTFHEVTAPERIIRTFEFEGMPERGHVSLETATFEELPNVRSRWVVHSVFRSVEDRDGMANSMGPGVNDSYERLEAVLLGM